MEGLIEEFLESGRRVRLHDESVKTRIFRQGAIGRIAKGTAGHEPNLSQQLRLAELPGEVKTSKRGNPRSNRATWG